MLGHIYFLGFDCDSQQVIGANLMICDLSCDEGNAVKQPCLSSLGNVDKVTDGMGKAANLSNTALRSDENPDCRPAQFALQINSDLKETWRKCTPLFKKYPDVELILHKINKGAYDIAACFFLALLLNVAFSRTVVFQIF